MAVGVDDVAEVRAARDRPGVCQTADLDGGVAVSMCAVAEPAGAVATPRPGGAVGLDGISDVDAGPDRRDAGYGRPATRRADFICRPPGKHRRVRVGPVPELAVCVGPQTATVPSLWRKYVVLLPATWTTFAPADKTVRFGERWYPPNVGTDHPTSRPSPSNATESPGHPPKARAPSIWMFWKASVTPGTAHVQMPCGVGTYGAPRK